MKKIFLYLFFFINTPLYAQYTTINYYGNKVMVRESCVPFFNNSINKPITIDPSAWTHHVSTDAIQITQGSLHPIVAIGRAAILLTEPSEYLAKDMPNLFLSADGAVVVRYDHNFDAWKVWPVTGKYYSPEGCKVFR
jgi:hypothetical protein